MLRCYTFTKRQDDPGAALLAVYVLRDIGRACLVNLAAVTTGGLIVKKI